jgi:hypothetical protein
MDTYSQDTTLVYKEIDETDVYVISLFLSEIFNNSKFTEDYLRDLYFKENSVIGINVFNESRLIAHYCVLRKQYLHGEGQLYVGWSVNTAVDKDFRGKGFFLDLATRTYNLARKHGVQVIVGVANRISTRLFLEKLAFRDLGNIRWNLDILSIYSTRKTYPITMDHIYTRTFRFRENIYLYKYPFVKIFSPYRVSFMSLYLTSRKSDCKLGVKLPMSWFKSNWCVIGLSLYPENLFIDSFLSDFAVDIGESDTF